MVTCKPGAHFDSLVKRCVENFEDKPYQDIESQPIQRPTTAAPAVVSPSVWISLVVVVNGSILALFLWLIIYKRQKRRTHTADAEASMSPEVQLAGGSDLAAAEREGPPTSCPHLNGGPNGVIKQEIPTWRKASEYDTGDGGNMHVCNGRKDHGIPLPATELGDAALVTTKTVQCTE